MSNTSPERLAVFEQISNEYRGVNSAAQRQRFKAALIKLGKTLLIGRYTLKGLPNKEGNK